MTNVWTIGFAAIVGLLLGGTFFGGLWWTVRRGLSLEQPAFLFLGSLLLRTALVVSGLYLVSRGDWRRLVASLAGFSLARVWISRKVSLAHPAMVKMRHGGKQ